MKQEKLEKAVFMYCFAVIFTWFLLDYYLTKLDFAFVSLNLNIGCQKQTPKLDQHQPTFIFVRSELNRSLRSMKALRLRTFIEFIHRLCSQVVDIDLIALIRSLEIWKFFLWCPWHDHHKKFFMSINFQTFLKNKKIF